MRKIFLGLFFVSITLYADEIYATFNVEANKKANLAFDTSGIVDKVLVDIGSVIKKDDILLVLKNSDYKAKLDIAKTSFEYAKKELERQNKVRSIIDKAKYDKYKFNYENAINQLNLQQSLFDKTILKAPFDSIVYDKLVESGDVVSGAMIRTILKIQNETKRKLILEFDQKYNKIVKIGDNFKYKIDGIDTIYNGKISKIYPYSDTKTRKIKAEIEVNNLMVGLFGDGYITIGK
ncbi:MAG: efflux RND transporter periplasmic adaptor subunit [Campylobacterota bacterium]|nr:efflux RND transporter periplasmic adaptor subunit [Campylobacterota bacterium]